MNLPIYKAVIVNDNCGVERISLVDYPAVEVDFLAFASDIKQIMFSANEEKHIITGVLLRADYPIYRNDSQLGEYYIKFDRETIKNVAEKLLKDGNHNAVNLQHIPNSDVEGVDMVEIFFKNAENGINPKGFENITDGSLMATFKVHNEKIWNAIKEGVFNGFSIEGNFGFDLELSKEDNDYEEVMKMINELEKIMKK
jgi:hypothetical protein